MKLISTYAKYGKEVHTYAAKSIFSCMFPCACSQWSRRAENSGNVSSVACNQLCLLSDPVAAVYSMRSL